MKMFKRSTITAPLNLLLLLVPVLALTGYALVAVPRLIPQPADPARLYAPCTTYVTGDVITDTTWTAAASPYCLSTSVQVQSYATLTLQPGVQVYAENTGISLVVYGKLQAVGTAAQPITLSAQSGSPAGWVGLVFEGNAGRGLGNLDYVTLRYAGSSYYGSQFGLGVFSGANVTMRHSQISDSAGDGVYVSGEETRLVFEDNSVQNSAAYPIDVPLWAVEGLSRNTFTGNHPDRVLVAKDGTQTLFADSTWRKSNGGGVYELANDIDIDTRATLALEPGVTVYNRTGVSIVVNGRMDAPGLPDQPITFTSTASPLAAGSWVGLVFDGSHARGIGRLENVLIQYAGREYYGLQHSLGIHNQARVTVTGSQLENSAGLGVFVGSDSQVSFENNTVKDCGSYGMSVELDNLSAITNNVFIGNVPDRILIRASTLGVP